MTLHDSKAGLDPLTQVDICHEGLPPLEYVPFDEVPETPPYDVSLRDRIMIDTVHDGCIIHP